MDYKKIYDSIIESRKVNIILYDKVNYSEEHHILPVSLGGIDYKDNLVRVTAREHFILHALLVRMFEKVNKNFYNKMLCAFNKMRSGNKEHKRYFNSRLFEKYKKDFSKYMSEQQTGEGNSQFGTMWITNETLKENKKILKEELIPDGWKKGRTNYKKLEENIIKYTNLVKLYNESELDWESFREDNNLKGIFNNFQNISKKYSTVDLIGRNYIDIVELTNLCDIYVEYGYTKFCEITGYTKTLENITQLFKKYVKGFKTQSRKKRG